MSQLNWMPYTQPEELPWDQFWVAGIYNRNADETFVTLMYYGQDNKIICLDPEFCEETTPNMVTVTHWARYEEPEHPDDEWSVDYGDDEDLNTLQAALAIEIDDFVITNFNATGLVSEACELLEQCTDLLTPRIR